MHRIEVLVVALIAVGCGCTPRPAAPVAGPWSALAAMPARAEVAVAVSDAGRAAAILDDARELGGDELAAWLTPRFAGTSWPLDALASIGLDGHGPLVAARLDRDAGTVVRCARVVDAAALERALGAAALSPDADGAPGRAAERAVVHSDAGDVVILSSGSDAWLVRAGLACFVSSGARSRRDRAAVEIAAGDGEHLGDRMAALIGAVGAGDVVIATRGDTTGEVLATRTPGDAVIAISLAVDGSALTGRVAARPAPTTDAIELGLPVDPVPLPPSALPTWPVAPKDENPDVPLSDHYRRVAAQLADLDRERLQLAQAVTVASLDSARDTDRAFAARVPWQRRGDLAIAESRVAIGGSIAGAVARARDVAAPRLTVRDQILARYRAAAARYAELIAELVRARAHDVADHDRGHP